MADARVTTELVYKVNSKDIVDLGRQTGKALGPEIPRAFTREMRAVSRAVRETTREVQALVTEFRRLVGEMRKVGGAGGGGSWFGGINPSGGGGGGGGGGGVVPSPAPSPSPAPDPGDTTDPRRRKGFQLPMPGMSALATGAAGIPVAGGIAAGVILAAAATYGSYSSYQQARLGAVPGLVSARDALAYTSALSEEEYRARNAGNLGNPNLTVRDAWMIEGSMSVPAALRPRTDPLMSTTAIEGVGGAYGIRAQQAISMAGEMGQAMRTPASAADLDQALAMRTLFGIDTGTTAAFRGAENRFSLRARELDSNDPDVRAKAAQGSRETVTLGLLTTAVKLGMEGSEINEWLQQQTQYMEQASRRGLSGDITSMMTIQAGLKGIGIDKWRVGDITQQFASGAEQVGRTGLTGPGSIRLARAAGYTGRGGLDEYAEVMMRLQDPSQAAGIMQKYFADAMAQHGIDPNSPRAAWFMQRAAAQIGVQLGGGIAGGEAGTFARGIGGLDAAGAAFSGTLGSAGSVAAFDAKMRDSGKHTVGMLADTQIREAQIEQRKISVGRDVSKAVLDFEESTLALAKVITGTTTPALDVLTDTLRNLTVAAAGLTVKITTRL